MYANINGRYEEDTKGEKVKYYQINRINERTEKKHCYFNGRKAEDFGISRNNLSRL